MTLVGSISRAVDIVIRIIPGVAQAYELCTSSNLRYLFSFSEEIRMV